MNSVAAGGSAGEATHQYIDRVVKGVFETRRDAYVAAQSMSTVQGRNATRTLLSPGRTASRSCALLRLRLPRLTSSTRRATAFSTPLTSQSSSTISRGRRLRCAASLSKCTSTRPHQLGQPHKTPNSPTSPTLPCAVPARTNFAGEKKSDVTFHLRIPASSPKDSARKI